jgi:hypothetical protein
MPVIVVTRLRLKDPALLEEFFTHAVAVLEQAIKSEDNLGADALAEAHDTWWSVTAWQDRSQMQAFTETEPHRSTADLLDHLCDEATFVDWDQADLQLPDWQACWRHLVADGHSAELSNPSDANQRRAFRPRSRRREPTRKRPQTARPPPPPEVVTEVTVTIEQERGRPSSRSTSVPVRSSPSMWPESDSLSSVTDATVRRANKRVDDSAVAGSRAEGGGQDRRTPTARQLRRCVG